MTAKHILSIDEMLATDDVEFALVPWGTGFVRIGTLSVGQMQDFNEKQDNPATKKTAWLRMFIDSLVDEFGNRIGNAGMIEKFRGKSNAAVQRVGREILELNGFVDTPLDFQQRAVKAGTDEQALNAVIADMYEQADALTAAGTDKKKLTEVLRGRKQADAKNDSGETASVVSPIASPVIAASSTST